YRGAPVRKGQLIGWMGDSGNAENVGSHLHFEIRRPDGTAIDPYQSLLAALKAGGSAPASVQTPIPAATAVAASTAPATLVFKYDLFFNMTHPDVKELQKFLNSHGFTVAAAGPGSKGKETDYFGNATRAALIKLQKAKNISPAAGYFGPLTREVVNGMNK
ncbi:MAG TPA: peptidoglycan-binding protein, partial [Candidatus Methylomirabilis sp.]|nr:peptidoglycan-binding protein [Candidatus Methylomirabilis sp.]